MLYTVYLTKIIVFIVYSSTSKCSSIADHGLTLILQCPYCPCLFLVSLVALICLFSCLGTLGIEAEGVPVPVPYKLDTSHIESDI